ncbi:molybdopterin converting factor subunit 1 [Ferviditalea candida]|uniref:Molybdopterin synthase sulfur carrier subunit n=1 Tax=Ferviditalea candida TaxID=3108399 RepID=A0ABU5ZFU4_9BACL|nr:molybdopterin converting factor subunit 1 [Paenibacillaceae bacterium T2]
MLLFAGLAEAAGCSEVQFDGEAMRVSELRQQLTERFPLMKDKLSSCLAAVNQDYVSEESTVHPGDEVAFIPPVSGG